MTIEARGSAPDSRPGTGRYLTHDLPGIGGAIKVHPDDFVVEEIPLYPPWDRVNTLLSMKVPVAEESPAEL